MKEVEGGIRHALRTGAKDPALAAGVLGSLYIVAGLLCLGSLLLPYPAGAHVVGLLGIGVSGVGIGSACLVLAKYAKFWALHIVLACGTALICLAVCFSGVESGIYSYALIWIAVMTANFLPPRAVGAHIVWVLTAWGASLALVEEPSGFSTITRWVLGAVVLVIAAVVVNELQAGRMAVEGHLRKENAEKARLQRELERLAHHDPLTGLANRRRFEQALVSAFARANRTDAPLCLVALDLDMFKEYNDLHGHGAGDELLKLSAGAWSRSLRADDLLARMGGDEFVALLPGTPKAEAERVVQRLRGDVPLGVSCSAGIAHWDGSESGDKLLGRADQEMYRAKRRVMLRTDGRRPPGSTATST
jgi:diguanylate cyclase (GGDEF)-like protein